MTTSTGQSDIDAVREATDLVQLVGEHVALTPRGREYVGLCPFHDDRRPSLSVVTHKGHVFYKCFACGASGDCFRFVMEYHRMSFPDALRYLAERAGITLRRRQEAPSGGPRRGDLHDVLVTAARFFQRMLQEDAAGRAARELLEQRGIGADLIDTFMLGAAPAGYEGFLRTLPKRIDAIQTAVAAGLLKPRSEGRGHYDTFRHRLIFPICDDVGRPIAFGGRSLAPDDQPKYLNSPESPLFKKSRTLYGLHLAKRSIIDAGRAVVTEGYTDVIACHQAGITNVVGTLGTALTDEHATILSRLCDTVVLVFDGDAAGEKAADRGVEVFFAEPVDVRICTLPAGCDPDELIRQPQGADRFRALLEASVDALEFKLGRFERSLDGVTSLSARQRRLEGFLAELARLGFGTLQGVRKRLVVARLAELFRVPMGVIEQALPRTRSATGRGAPTASGPAPASPGASRTSPPDHEPLLEASEASAAVPRARQMAERELLSVLLFEPDAAASARLGEGEHEIPLLSLISVDSFIDPPTRRIAEVVLSWLQRGTAASIQDVLAQLADEPARALASGLFFDGQRKCEDDAAAAARDAAKALLACIHREDYEQHVAAFRGTGGQEAPAADLDDVVELIRKRNQHGDLPSAISQGVRS